jgi:nucleoside-diphosphate-sugar epimerase
MNKVFILGAKSFVGKSLHDLIKDKEESYLVSKEKINFLDTATFQNINFNSSIIVDCINVNNGNEKDIMNCNITGFSSFLNYLKKNATDFKYIYISTVSVLSKESVETSHYVKSKKNAEEFLINSGINYQIVRLSYPIGKNENSNRLISRLIENLKNNKPISVNNVLINLNCISDVVKEIYHQFSNSGIFFISNNQYLYLKEIVLLLKDKLNSKSTVEVFETQNQFQPLSEHPFIPSVDIKSTLLQMI